MVSLSYNPQICTLEIAGYIASAFIGLSMGLIGGGGSILTIPVTLSHRYLWCTYRIGNRIFGNRRRLFIETRIGDNNEAAKETIGTSLLIIALNSLI
jgi:hypothetical protein